MPGTARHRRTLATIAAAVLVAATAAFATGGAPAGAADEPLTVDIRVELDFFGVGPSSGPRVFEVAGVDAAGGVWELTEIDEIDNPMSWCGSVMVDVDPDTRLITVATEEVCNFHTAHVIITSDQITDVTLVSDDLWGLSPEFDEGRPMDPVQISHAGDSFDLFWNTDLDEDDPDDGGSYLLADGTAVFAFTLVGDDEEPTTTVPEETTTTVVEEEPTTTTAAEGTGSGAPAAAPVKATPSYTG